MKTLLLMGTGRSGTTWLAGLLAKPFRYRLIFEPFHPDHVPGANLVADRYCPPGSIPETVQHFLRQVLEDRIDSDWIAQDSNRRFRMHRWRFWPRARIFKIVRGNLLIPALRSLYGPQLPIVLIVRNPCAVVESFLRVRFPWGMDIETLLNQHLLQEIYGLPVQEYRKISTSPAGALAIRWVLENAYLLPSGDQLNLQIVRYEDVVRDPVREIEAIARHAGLDTVADLSYLATHPSHTSHHRGSMSVGYQQPDPCSLLADSDRTIVQTVLEMGNVSY